jgi:hypothetical protein
MYNINEKKKIFFLGDKLFNQGDYPQVLSPHTSKATLLFHLLREPKPSKKKPYKKSKVFFNM